MNHGWMWEPVRGLAFWYLTCIFVVFLHSNQVIKAPEPDNIIWENLEFSKFKRRMRQNVTSLVSFILLLIAFVLVLAASGVQDHYAQIIPKLAYCQKEVRAATSLLWASIHFVFFCHFIPCDGYLELRPVLLVRTDAIS